MSPEKPEKLVKDIMRPLDQYEQVHFNAPVVEAVKGINKALRQQRPLCLVVIDEENNKNSVIKGFVTKSELVFGLSSHFLKGSKTSGPIFWEGQFEVEYLEGIQKKVKDIMIPIEGFVHDSEMIMESIFLLNKHRVEFLPVIRKDDVVGIIHLEDILKEISTMVLKRTG